MALRPAALYPDQIDTSDPAYPHGKAQNDLVEGDGAGTPLEKGWVSELFGFEQALLDEAGLTPNGVAEKVGASQYLEAVKILGGQRLLSHRGLQEWSGEQIAAPADDTGDDTFCYLAATGQSTLFLGKRQALIAIGKNQLDAAVHGFYLRSQDGSRWDDRTGVDYDLSYGSFGGLVPLCVAAGQPGEFLVGVDTGAGVVCVRVGSFGLSGNDIATFSGPAFGLSAVFYAVAIGKYLVATDNQQIERSATFTAGWSASSAICDSALAMSAYDAPGGSFAEDGTTNVVFCASAVIGGVTRFRVWHSTDGATWTVALTGDNALTGMDVAWHAQAGVFIALASNGKFYTSPDGLTWALKYTTNITAANYAIAKHGTLAVAGNCIAKVIAIAPAANFRYPGLVYSLDLGATWYVTTFGKGFGRTTLDAGIDPLPLASVIAANGRFYATDLKNVYRSGLVVAPAVMYTSV